MAEVDTSSYLKPTPPKSALEVASDFGKLKQQQQQIESGGLTIDAQKLNNANQALGYLTRAFSSIGPNGTKDDYYKVGQNAVQLGLVPPAALNTYKQRLDAAKTPQDFFNEIMTAAASHGEVIDYHLGRPGLVDTGQANVPVRTPLAAGQGAPVQTGLPIQHQLPPGTEVPTVAGTQRQGAQPYEPSPSPVLPTGPINAAGVTGQSNNFGGNIVGAERLPVQQPRGPMASQPPMFEAGKKQLVEDQDLATGKLTAIKPALQALPLMKNLISSGPGTQALTATLAGLSNAGLIPQGLTDKVAAQQEVIKKLNQYVSNSPVAARSDAAQTLAEASSPTPKVQVLPALIKLTKDAIILDRVQAARANAFVDDKGDQRNDLHNYGKHRSTFAASVDEKAFGLDLMEPKERKELITDMQKKKNTPEGRKFWKSLAIVDKLGYIDTGLE